MRTCEFGEKGMNEESKEALPIAVSSGNFLLITNVSLSLKEKGENENL
jgi:hypothetical protein